MNYFGLIMAGGDGTRFWPLSRHNRPKHLLNLTGNGYMINEAIDRMATVMDRDHIMIITNAAQAEATDEIVRDRIRGDHILLEPAARNTAACIAYAAMKIHREHGDSVMLITPADHYIRDVGRLTAVFEKVISKAASGDKLITIGIQPTFPATGYGYIRTGQTEDGFCQVLQFREKPDRETAEAYLRSGEYLWNSGIFAWRTGMILDRIHQYAPDIYDAVAEICDAAGTDEADRKMREVYPTIRKISIDYAVMEPAASQDDVLVIPGDFGWSDIGSWETLEAVCPVDEHHNVVRGETLLQNVNNSIICSNGRLIAAADVDNLVIVETDDAIMICPREKAQEVRNMVSLLKENGRMDLI